MRAAQLLIIGFVAAALNIVLLGEGWSQAYPTRTIQLVVAYAAAEHAICLYARWPSG